MRLRWKPSNTSDAKYDLHELVREAAAPTDLTRLEKVCRSKLSADIHEQSFIRLNWKRLRCRRVRRSQLRRCSGNELKLITSPRRPEGCAESDTVKLSVAAASPRAQSWVL
ncbi:hypothetical protein F2P81_022803 [Scophthalmus maximus]|uniref:Uncharacterized protein n=1 Tax=Scophthalmus maximus TaxID=52904 RepID=A0A6A4S3L4_SCOMX|nr:hypothetical protein F2P81_022803 [Scophthalmus maximus]